MPFRLLYTFLLLAVGSSFVTAQTFSPLGGYNFPSSERGKPLPVTPKSDCGTFDLEDLIRILPGETSTIAIGLDTVGLDDGLTYTCTGCAEVDFGVVSFANDTLIFAADAGAEEELVELRFTACNAAGDCAPELIRTVLVQRPGTTTDLGSFAVNPSEILDVDIPLGNLPNPTFCRTVESCAPDYPGREQRAFFQFGINQDNEVRYVAARAAGTDVICATLCTELGLCDTYTASITVTQPTLNRTFFDDFSYEGFRPDPELWQDEDVLINRSFAQSPPSIGVATFDAIDHDGKPYIVNTGTSATSIRDYLTSTPLALRDSVGATLSFYLQPRGLGNRPERLDSFLVEFLSVDGVWERVLGVEGVLNTIPTDSILPFQGFVIPLEESYLYDGFQFRFANKSNEVGAVDMWHLDYVKLSPRAISILNNDISMVSEPETITEPYTSMPTRHFVAAGNSAIRDTITLRMFNHRGTDIAVNANTILFRESAVSNITSGELLFESLFDRDTNVFVTQEYSFDQAFLPEWANYSTLQSYLTGLDPNVNTKIEIRYRTRANGQDFEFSPLIATNDTVTSSTIFDEYFAYDDGSAELTIEIDPDNTILQEYDIFVNDQLVGVQVAIPRGLGPLGDQDLRLVVYTGDTIPETLIYEEDFPVLQPEDFFFDTLQGFTTYRFAGPLNVTAGKLYVGWEQTNAARNIGVGFDRNNAPEDVQWFNVGNGFQRLRGTTTGAIMLRPLMSGFEGFQTSTDDPATEISRVEVYPNPTSGTLHLRPRQGLNAPLNNLTYRLFGFSGALLRSGPTADRLDLGDLPAGIYLLELTDGAHRERHKIVRH